VSKELTIALDRYDRHLPLFFGAARLPDGQQYRALEVGMVPPRRDGVARHRRMLIDLEFDAAEVSLCSYIMAKKRGVPLTGIPAFPRRLFSQNHIYVNVNSGIRAPQDLVGKRVGLWAFQVTMSVLAKGDRMTIAICRDVPDSQRWHDGSPIPTKHVSRHGETEHALLRTGWEKV
jgi:4,5-dihydroxyphthalate decarboxylase